MFKRADFSSLVLLLLCVLLGGFVLAPYICYNQLLQWDAVGHLFSSWFIREHLFPAWKGWNPYFFAGFPQGEFYPPLFHYLAAVVSLFMPLRLAIVLLVSVSLLALPLVFFAYARTQDLTREQAACAASLLLVLITLPFAYSNSIIYIGGTLLSTINVGLVTNAFSLPFLLVYLVRLPRCAEEGRWVEASMWLAVLVLSHLLTAFVAAIYFLVVLAYGFNLRNCLPFAIKHVLLTSALTAAWVVPFLVHLPWAETIRIPLDLGLSSFVLFVVSLAVVCYRHFLRRPSAFPLSSAYFVVLLLVVLVLDALQIKLHAYRFVLYPLLLAPIIIAGVLPRRAAWAGSLTAVLILALFFVTRSEFYYELSPEGPANPAVEQMSILPQSRQLVLLGYDAQTSAHVYQHLLPRAGGFFGTKGLFVESSASSKYYSSLELLLDPTSVIWGVPFVDFSKVDAEDKKALADRMIQRLGIDGVVSALHLDNFSFESKRRLFSYSVDLPAFRIAFGGADYFAPAWEQPSYFAHSKDKLVFVAQEDGKAKLRLFSGVGCVSSKCIFRFEGTSYLARRYDDLRFMIEQTDAQAAEVFELEELASRDIVLAKEPRSSASFQLNLYHYMLPIKPLVQVLGTPVVAAGTQWPERVEEWFISSDEQPVLVDGAPESFADSVKLGFAEHLDVSTRQDTIKFFVESAGKANVLVRVSYFPNWRAYQSGKPIPVYRASPSFMLVQGRGAIELRYETPLFEYVCRGVSGFALLLVLLSFVLRPSRQEVQPN